MIVVAGATAGAGDGGVKKEATPENIRAFDVRTGKLLWIFNVVPHAGEYGVETWGEDSYTYSGDLASWCCLTADEELDLVYVPLSAPTGIVYGGHRPGTQPVLGRAGRARRQDRQAGLALPDGAPRFVGLRPAGRADPRRHHRRGRRIKAVVQLTKQAFALSSSTA